MAYHHGNLREALLERAADVIAEHGIEALSLRGLARDLGVSHAAPRAHFSDRKALLSALAVEGFRLCVDAMKEGADAAGPDPVARYRALGRSYVAFARANPSCFRAITHPEVQAHGDRVLAGARAAYYETLRKGVEAAQAAGWHPEVDTETLLAFSCAATMGAAQLVNDGSFDSIFEVEDAESFMDRLFDLVVLRSETTALPDLDPAAQNREADTSERNAS